jgi:hypothetical protein
MMYVWVKEECPFEGVYKNLDLEREKERHFLQTLHL